MFENPFTPLFGGRPDCFFGRGEILRRFDSAMRDSGSDDRALFITGSRGYGKTALLEQLSLRAREEGRTVIDVGSDNPIAGIMRHLFPFDESTKTVDPELEVNVLGTGGKVRGGSSSKTIHYDRDDFEYLFLKACTRDGFKLLVTIDEVQKVSLDDVSLISESFQMASRKGCDVMLAVAGLPYAYEPIIQNNGCTFLRRAAHEKLGPLGREEVRDALVSSFGKIKGLSLDEEALQKLVSASYGHPYLMQLQGYYLVDAVNQREVGRRHTIGAHEVEAVMPQVLEAYHQRALAPLVQVMPESEREYLRAMASVVDESRVVETADIAAALGREQKQLSMVRESLIDNGIVASPKRGALLFLIPYLAEYFCRNDTELDPDVAAALEWGM